MAIISLFRNYFMSRFLLVALVVAGAANTASTVLPAEEMQPRAAINGYLRDAETGETLLGANIILVGTNRGGTTNNAGYYIISNIPGGTYSVRYSYLGFNDKILEVTLEEGETLRLDVQLDPVEFTMEELVVVSERDREERQNIGRASVSTDLIKSVPSVLQADVFRAVQLLPGVKAASDFSSGLYIRGGGPDQTLILLDRTTVYNPSHFFGFFSTFNPDAIKDVRLYKGAYPATYGGRLGSVLDVYNRDGNRNHHGGTLSLGMLSSRAMIEGPHGGGSYMLAFRRSTLEPLLAALRSSVDNVPDAFYFYDINAKVNFERWQNNRLSIAAYTGTDDVRFPFGDDSQFNLFYGNRTLSMDWTHLISRRIFTNVTLTAAEYFNDPVFEFGGTEFERRNRIRDYSAKADLEWLPTREFELLAGFWGGRKIFSLDDFFDGDNTLSEEIGSDYVSTYVQTIWRPGHRWKFQTGLRANYFSSGNYLRLDPRIHAEFFATSCTRFQLAYGRYHQFLTLISNEAISAFDLWLITDDGVPPSYGDQYVFGIKNSRLAGYNFEVEIYYRTMRDLFEFDPFLPDAAGLAYADLFRFGEGYATGFELFLEKTSGRLYGFIGYTWGLTRRKFDEYNQNRFYPPKYDRTHDVNVVSNFRINRRWNASAVFSYATGQAYTEPLGRSVLTTNPFDGETIDYIVVGRVNASRLPAYHRLDVGVTRTGSFFGLAESEWQLQVINVYSRRNVWFYFYDFEENPVKRIEARMLPIIPAIGYTLRF